MIMVGFFLAVFAIIFVSKLLVFCRKNEAKTLLEQCFKLEEMFLKEQRNIGVELQLRLQPYLYCLLGIVSTIWVPAVMILLPMIRPCMPPLVSMRLFQGCHNSWNSDGGSVFLSRAVIAVWEGYTWWTLVASVIIFLITFLVYPAAVEELWITWMHR
jgi:hypothetical protein